MNGGMRRGKFLLPVLTAALVLAGCGGVDRRHYVAGNEALLRSLPLFPGATKIHEVSTPYVDSEGQMSGPSGYTTSVIYRVPNGGDGAVLPFYESRLRRRGWHSRRVGRNGVNFTRGGALVAVNTILPTYEVVIDYRGAGRAG
jgi:hypothetical protein